LIGNRDCQQRLLRTISEEESQVSKIHAIFWDVGGVLLSNAWDHTERAAALEHFHLDAAEFNARHEPIVEPFERGELSLDEYLDRTVFYCERPFNREAFRSYMFSLSQPIPETLSLARGLAGSGKYFMGTLNNESRELNLYRIEKYNLREIFQLFVSSCFVGLRKPESGIYRLANEITQINPAECCFIDDRAANLEAPSKLGMRTIQMKTPEQLRGDLGKLGVAVASDQ
jgi:putative hydrolase of the HAD superfamily